MKKMNFLATALRTCLVLLCLAVWPAWAAETNPGAVTALLNRIGGEGTAARFVTIVDETLAENGKEVFVITSQDGKPCIKGSNTLAVTTGINLVSEPHGTRELGVEQPDAGPQPNDASFARGRGEACV